MGRSFASGEGSEGVAGTGRPVGFRIGFGRVALVALACVFLANCGGHGGFARMVDPKYGVPSSPRVVEDGQPIPRGGGYRRVGNPYTVAGRTYVPAEDPNYRAEGIASWYGHAFHGRLTANGEVFDQHAISAAHPTLPIPSYARVTNLANRRSIVVRVNDRGPFHDNRIIDLSIRTAELLGFRANGIARVRVEYLGPASLTGSDDRKLLATLRHDGRPAPSPVQVASTSTFVPRAARTAARSDDDDEPVTRVGDDIRGGPVRRVASAGRAESRSVFPEPVRSLAPVVGPGTGQAAMTGRGLY
jgi:rare lipoprotein A